MCGRAVGGGERTVLPLSSKAHLCTHNAELNDCKWRRKNQEATEPSWTVARPGVKYRTNPHPSFSSGRWGWGRLVQGGFRLGREGGVIGWTIYVVHRPATGDVCVLRGMGRGGRENPVRLQFPVVWALSYEPHKIAQSGHWLTTGDSKITWDFSSRLPLSQNRGGIQKSPYRRPDKKGT